MSALLTREEWMDLRITELLGQSCEVASLVEDIQAAGGTTLKHFCKHIADWFCADSSAVRDAAADQATTIITAFAFIRAQREYDGKPLVP